MLGPSLLVAPVFVPDGEESEYYLPAGRWTSFFHPKRIVTGPVWVQEVVPLDEIPVWVRPNTIICLGPEKIGRPDYKLSENLEVRLYELDDGEKIVAGIPTGEPGKHAGVVTAERKGQEIKVSVANGVVGLASVALFGEGLEVKNVTGGKATGKFVQVENAAKEIVISL
jgi:alpha-glucosidase (family GH31 glycosyl hydrolase)